MPKRVKIKNFADWGISVFTICELIIKIALEVLSATVVFI